MRKLLDAGRVVFEQRGYHAARVDDVVKMAKTSHGTFYLYFSNKEDLFKALAEDAMAEMASLADEIGPIGPDDEGRAAVHNWVERFTDVYYESEPSAPVAASGNGANGVQIASSAPREDRQEAR